MGDGRFQLMVDMCLEQNKIQWEDHQRESTPAQHDHPSPSHHSHLVVCHHLQRQKEMDGHDGG